MRVGHERRGLQTSASSAVSPDSDDEPRVDGVVSAGFEPVADAFRDGFRRRGDTGAACAVYAHGKLVVDIWAGSAATGPWHRDTRSCVFSVSKGVLTTCLLMAAERGDLAIDAPVAAYWPEFATAGKEQTTVRQVLAHQAGLIAPAVDLTWADVRDWYPVCEVLAEQAPAWRPGTSYAYHALTLGWLAGEILRRATGRRPGQWLAEEIAAPLGLATTLGANAAADYTPFVGQVTTVGETGADALVPHLSDPMVERALSLGGLFDPADMLGLSADPRFLGCEIPAGNLVSDARSLARLYAALVSEIDGVRLLQRATVADAMAPQSNGRPHVGPSEGHRWGTGFMLSSDRVPMFGPGSFGHDGAGGHLACALPGHAVGFAYITNRGGGAVDVRATEICMAVRRCL